MSTEAPFSGVLDDLEQAGTRDRVTAGDVLDAFEHRSLGVLLTLFGLIASLPVVGGIPGVSEVAAVLMLLAVAQSYLGGGALWMPKVVRTRSVSRDRFGGAIDKVRPWVEWVDHLLKPRLKILIAGRAARHAAALAVVLLALSFFPLAVVPYGVTPAALGVLCLGLGLMACDGLLALIGYICAAGTAYVLYAAI